jgi:hypothetical protein
MSPERGSDGFIRMHEARTRCPLAEQDRVPALVTMFAIRDSSSVRGAHSGYRLAHGQDDSRSWLLRHTFAMAEAAKKG